MDFVNDETAKQVAKDIADGYICDDGSPKNVYVDVLNLNSLNFIEKNFAQLNTL